MTSRRAVFWPVLAVLFLGACALSLLVGPGGAAGLADPRIACIRLMRLALGVLAGGVLGIGGAALQALLRNTLADPYTLGTASGATLGVSVAIALGAGTSLLLPVAGFAGALVTTVAVYLLARVRSRVTATGLVLAGVIAGFFMTGLVMLVIVLSRRPLGQAVFLLMGHLGTPFTGASARLFAGCAAVAVAGCGVLVSLGRELDIMSGSAEAAESLGVDTGRRTRDVFVLTSLLTGIVVSFTGAVSFVGLVVPHLVRLGIGPRNSTLLPAAFVAGSALLVLADVLARNIVPGGLPLSVVTAFLGVPFFVYLLRSRL